MATQQATREAIDDGVITSKVRTALMNDAITAIYDIHVETVASIVDLTGFVASQEVRDEALQVARSVQGVQQVNDSMDVRPG